MTDSNLPLIPARDDQLTPESISERTFTAAKRGYSETEVRAYLRRVADDVASLLGRERDLAHRVSQLEGEVNQPRPALSDQQLITALGEETARVLGQAREAAVDLRNKAEEHARRVVREAQEAAKELRTTAQSAVETKTREAEDAARARANEIVGEARVMRERVLTDLSERRQELERQIGDLRGTRAKLVDAYETVERALGQATNLMAQETPMRVSVVPPVAEPATTAADADDDAPADATDDSPSAREPAPVDSTPASDEVAEVAEPGNAVEGATRPSSDASAADDADDAESRDVSVLFDQLRSGADPTETASDDAALGFTEAAVSPAPPEASEELDISELEAGEVDEELTPDQALLAARDDALAEALEALSRRAKRALQDEQNDILDGVRRPRGKLDVDKVLPSHDDQLARWAHVLQPAVDRAYGTGAASAGATTDRAPAPVLAEMAAVVVNPLRERLASALASIDEPTPADTEIAIAQRLGARYREWRSQHLDHVLADVIAAAHSRGVYDAAPEGSRLRWVPFVVGKCPDCDDNALEPTVRGSEFPTGQQHPPAHPGCRCLIVIDADN